MLRPMSRLLTARLQESDPTTPGAIVLERSAAIKLRHPMDRHPAEFGSVNEHADDPPRVVIAIITQPRLVHSDERGRPSISINIRDRRRTHRDDGQAKDD